MRKYKNITYIQDVIPRITDPDTGYVVNEQGVANTQLFLTYVEGHPESISYFWDFMCGWNKVDTITIHDTRDSDTVDDLVGLAIFRKKLSVIRAHIKHSIKLCDHTEATEYSRRVATIGERSTATLSFHRDYKGGCTWTITDCRNKARYFRSTGDKIRPFLEQMLISLDRNLRELTTYTKYVTKDIHRTHLKKGDVDTPDSK